MGNYFKILSQILLGSILILILCCNSIRQNQVEILFWGMGAEGEHIKSLILDFEKNNPELKVKVQMIPWTAAQEKLITAYASNNLPDAFQLGNTWIPQFATLDAIDSLNNWVDNSEHIKKENYFDGIWDTNILDGTLYGIPWYIDTRVLFYRTDVLRNAGFSSPPKTWDDLYLACKNIKELFKDQEKYAIYIPTNEWAPFVIFGLQANSTLLKDNNSYGNFSGENFKRAFKFLIHFHTEKLAPIGISQVTNVYQAFANEYFSMYISGPWNIGEFKKWMVGDLKDKWMTAPLPGPDSKTPGLSLAGGSSLVMSSATHKKEAVWKFFEYLSQPQNQIKFYRLVSDLPAVKSAWQDSTLKNDPYLKAFYSQFQHVVATPKIPEWEQIAFSKIQQYAEVAARGVMTPEEALKALDADVNKILEKRRWLLSKKK